MKKEIKKILAWSWIVLGMIGAVEGLVEGIIRTDATKLFENEPILSSLIFLMLAFFTCVGYYFITSWAFDNR